jgi:DNA-binding transcriptional LysR family regulator
MQLKQVAQAVGLPLYEIVSKKIYLTDVGKELATTARTIADAWDAFEQGIDQTKGLTRGKLRVAVVSTAKYFMPRMIGTFCKLHPAIDVSLEILNRDGVVRRLRENTDDIYIMSRPPADMPLRDEVFMENPIVMIASASDPLVRRANIPIQELRKHRFVLREQGSGTRMAADEFFGSRRFRPDIRLELGSNEAIKEAVAGGLGIGIISLHALHGHRKEHGVSVINVDGFPIASKWHLVHPERRMLSPIAAAFREHLLVERHVRSERKPKRK